MKQAVIDKLCLLCYRLKELYSIRDTKEVHPANNIAGAIRELVEWKQDTATKPTIRNRSVFKEVGLMDIALQSVYTNDAEK